MFVACVLVIIVLISEVKLLLRDLKVEGKGSGQRDHIIFPIVVKFVLF